MQGRIGEQLHTATRVAKVVIGGIVLLLMLVMAAAIVPSMIGYQSFVVYGGSMEPSIDVGDLAIIGPTKPTDLQVGDILTYRMSDRPETLIMHRLIAIETDQQGGLLFQTKGDANETVDNVVVEQGAILGRVVFTLPRIGYIVHSSKQAEGKLLLIVMPVVVMAVEYLLAQHRRRSRGIGESLAAGA